MKKSTYLFALALGVSTISLAQNVGINTDGSDPDTDALLHLLNTNSTALDPLIRLENQQGASVNGIELLNSGGATAAEWDLYIPSTTTDFRVSNGTTDHVTIQNDGDVGIGTTTPTVPLDIESAGAAIDINNTSTDPLIHFQESGTTNFTIGTDVTDSKFKIGTTALETGTAITVQSTGEVGIGTTSPSSLVEISSGTAGDAVLTISADTDNNDENDNPKLELLQDGGSYGGYVQVEAENGTFATNTLLNALLLGPSGTDGLTQGAVQIVTNGAARMTVEPSGEVGIGTSTPSEELEVNGQVRFGSNGVPIAYFNRTTSDGWLLVFEQDGTTEGTISIAGSTVSYNAFTGSHYAYSKEETFERGMLVSFNGNNEHLHNNQESEILYGINYTAKANDNKIAGVFLNKSESSLDLSMDNPYQIMAVGNGDVWVTDEGGYIATGDYLISSSTVGHAMKDNGDYEVSHIFAKATESVDWSTVEPDSNGVKRKKIIVYFEAFDKPNYEKKFKEQQAIIEAQKKENESQKAEIENLKQATSSAINSSTDNAKKFAALEAKLNALLLNQNVTLSAKK